MFCIEITEGALIYNMDSFCVTFIFKDQHRITIWTDKTELVKHKRKKVN